MSNVKLKIMKEKLFKIAKILVNRSIRTWNNTQADARINVSSLACIINDLETEILIYPCTNKYMFNIDKFVKIAESLGANYYIDVTKNILDEPAACFVLYF